METANITPCEGMEAMAKVYEEAMAIRDIMSGNDDCGGSIPGGDGGTGSGSGVADVTVNGVSVVDPNTRVANINLSGEADLSALKAHIQNKSNPHAVTKAQVGLSNVDNTSDANKPISTAVQNALNGKASQASLSSLSNTVAGKADLISLNTHVQNKANPHTVTKAQVGLGDVDNTSDANKPVSTRQQAAINAKADQTALLAESTTRANADTALQTKVSNSKVTGLLFNPTTHTLSVSFGDGTSLTAVLPEASDAVDGFMSSGDYAALRQAVLDLQSLKEGGVWRANFETYADLIAAYPNLNVSATNWFSNDFVYVNADETHDGKETSYIVQTNGDVKTLVFERVMPSTGGASVQQATNTTLGVIKGSTVAGRGFVNADGTISLNGYDELISSINGKAAQADLASHTSDTDNPHSVTKAQVGLSNVDNTSDIDKPISNIQQTALDGKQPSATPAQQDALDSGITAEKVAQYDQAVEDISSKQNKLTGITDIQYVTALPSNPVATVLYLIPE